MKPQVKQVGNLFDRVAEVCSPPPAVQTFSVGDWVWARRLGRTTRLYLARIESATPIEAAGELLWFVRIYRSGRGWQPPEHRRVAAALNPAEVLQHRQSGQIPPAGQALP